MPNLQKKRETEKAIISQMIAVYCRRNHHSKSLCSECAELERYCHSRSDHCPFMETKTFCSNCKVHCYKPDMREKIRTVMRYSGPWMLLYHPAAAIRHWILLIQENRKQHT